MTEICHTPPLQAPNNFFNKKALSRLGTRSFRCHRSWKDCQQAEKLSKVYIVINVFKCLAILPLENLENVGQLFAFCLGECWAIVSLGWRMLGNCTLLHLTPAFFWQHLTPAFFWPQTATRVFHVYTSGNFRQSNAMGHTRLSAAVSMMACLRSGSSR